MPKLDTDDLSVVSTVGSTFQHSQRQPQCAADRFTIMSPFERAFCSSIIRADEYTLCRTFFSSDWGAQRLPYGETHWQAVRYS